MQIVVWFSVFELEHVQILPVAFHDDAAPRLIDHFCIIGSERTLATMELLTGLRLSMLHDRY